MTPAALSQIQTAKTSSYAKTLPLALALMQGFSHAGSLTIEPVDPHTANDAITNCIRTRIYHHAPRVQGAETLKPDFSVEGVSEVSSSFGNISRTLSASFAPYQKTERLVLRASHIEGGETAFYELPVDKRTLEKMDDGKMTPSFYMKWDNFTLMRSVNGFRSDLQSCMSTSSEPRYFKFK